MSREVFFETITPAHRPLVMRCVRRGDRVLVYDFTCRLKEIGWLAPLINDGRVERIYVQPLSRADAVAIRAVAWLFPRLGARPVVARLEAIFGADDTAAVLQRALLDAVFPYVYIRLDLEARAEGRSERVLIASTYRRWERALRAWPEALQPLADLRMPRVAGFVSSCIERAERRRTAARVVGSALRTLLRARLGHAAEPPERAFDHVYAIEQPFQTKFEGGRRVDFLIDGERLTRKNTAFLVADSADGAWAQQAVHDGLEVLRWRDYAGRARPRETGAPARAGHGRLALASLLALTLPSWLRDAAAIATWVAVTDAPLLERVRPRNYIYTNQDTVLQGWRNALLRRHGVASWCFTQAIGGGYLYTDGPEADHRFWAFQNPDHFVTASAAMVAYHQRHHQRVRHYHALGNIWSEIALDVERRVGRDALRASWFGRIPGTAKVVAWFDTSFIEAEHSPSTYREAIAWYGDLERFLDEFPDVYVVVKPSKDEGYFIDPLMQWSDALGPKVMEIWRRLAAHPRVYFPGHRGDPTTIIGGSDLVITYCFSSISAEALGAGRRALWYEPDAQWRDALYARGSGLVAHGYAELVTRTRALLYETTDAEYRAYLDRHVRGVVEEHLDGGGLTRFRRLLAERGA